jgi:GH24 family phage-related lysozyme (muramidase)
MNIGPDGISLIKSFESCAKLRTDGKFDAYPDAGRGWDLPTIGWGHTGPEVRKGIIWTQAECDTAFARDMGRYAAEVTAALRGAETTQHQFDALVSFHYNTGAIFTAHLTALHRAGAYTLAAEEFGKWVHAGHNVLPGLVKRRAAEAALYSKRVGSA